jgi:hypothetical protein
MLGGEIQPVVLCALLLGFRGCQGLFEGRNAHLRCVQFGHCLFNLIEITLD